MALNVCERGLCDFCVRDIFGKMFLSKFYSNILLAFFKMVIKENYFSDHLVPITVAISVCFSKNFPKVFVDTLIFVELTHRCSESRPRSRLIEHGIMNFHFSCGGVKIDT